jgi:hypothetical protein
MMEPRKVAQPDQLPHLGSSRVLIRFVLTAIILVSFAAFSSVGFAKGLAVLTWIASLVSAVIAVIRRERPFEPTLNRWDEMLCYVAVFCLISIFTHQTTG